jgi:hypothetical protein
LAKETYRNLFDELGAYDQEEADRQTVENRIVGEKCDYLIHKIFEQTEEGQELIAIWKDALDTRAGADVGMEYLEIGIIEGYKRFIRHIIRTIKKVEAG